MAEAERLTAYLEHSVGALVMPRDHWDALGASSTSIVRIDLEATPMAGIAHDACLIGAVAHRQGVEAGRISIYRDDPQDAPESVNADHYRALLDLGSHPDLGTWVVAASTQDNANLREYLDEHAILIKETPAADHHAVALPSTVSAALDWTPPEG